MTNFNDPVRRRSLQTSCPDSVRGLPNRNLNLRNKNSGVLSPLNFVAVSRLEEQAKSLDQVGARLFNRRTLTYHVELWTKRHIHIVFELDNRGQVANLSHDSMVAPSVDLAGIL